MSLCKRQYYVLPPFGFFLLFLLLSNDEVTVHIKGIVTQNEGFLFMYFVPILFHFLGELIPEASVMANLQWYLRKILYSVTFIGSLFPTRMVLLNYIVTTEYYISVAQLCMKDKDISRTES